MTCENKYKSIRRIIHNRGRYGIRTHAPFRARRLSKPVPFRSANLPKHARFWIETRIQLVTEEGTGFEPVRPFGLAGLANRCLSTRPTFHISTTLRRGRDSNPRGIYAHLCSKQAPSPLGHLSNQEDMGFEPMHPFGLAGLANRCLSTRPIFQNMRVFG